MRAVIQISVNGEARSVEAGTTVAALLAQMALTGKRVAVERNGEIVPKSRHGESVVAEADQLEIVVAVGGG
jgi:sulfur carrier protein